MNYKFLLLIWVGISFAKGIVFNGVIDDDSFLENEILNVEILETGEALKVKSGEKFTVTLPEDTLWNICLTDNDTAGAEREKCFQLIYTGTDSTFFKAIGDKNTSDFNSEILAKSDSVDSLKNPLGDTPQKDTANVLDDINVDGLLANNSAKVTEMKKVVVQLRRRPKRKAGESVVSAKSIKRMPGLAEADVIRSIQALPGVVASSDFSTKIYVRGGAADQNLFLYDNAVVYSPTHFFGLFSTFLVETIDDVQFYKSGFPAQYGNRLSSVLKMDGRAGGDSTDEWFSKSSIKISTFAAQLHTEGHQGNSRWVVAGRTTYIGAMLDFFNWIGLLDFNLDYKFTDLQGTYQYNFSDDTKIKASFYVGSDVLDFAPLYMDWGNIAVPLNFYHRFNGDLDYNATLSFSRFYQNMEISDLMAIGMDLYTWSAKQWINFRGIENHTLTFGYDLEYDNSLFFEYISKTKVEDKQYPFHHVFYGQDAWRFGDMILAYGLRGNYQTIAEHFGLEPRASLTWNINNDRTLEFYGGHYLQYLNSIMFSDQESLNEFYYPAVTTSKGTRLKPASSNLFAVEFSERNIFEEYNATIGAYYKTQNDLKTFMMSPDSNSESSSDDFLLGDYFGSAEGYSLGYELSLRKDKGAIFGGISWSQSLSVLNGEQQIYFPNWHQPYALKLDAGINWRGDSDALKPHKKKGRYFRSSAILKYSAGMPITQKAGYFYENKIDNNSLNDEENIAVVAGPRNGGRQSNYFRLDIKPIDIGRENKWNFSWTIINVTNHENMFYGYYDTSKNPPKYETVSQFPFLPVMVNYEYYF